MKNTAILEQGEDYGQTVTAVASAPLLRSGGNIDGFFRARTMTKPRATGMSPVKDSVATLAGKAPDVSNALPGSAPEIRDVIKPTSKPRRPSAVRTINHARRHTPQAGKARSIAISHTVVKGQALEVRRGALNHVQHHAAQRSRTLRRDTVPAPELSTHNLLKPNHALQHKAPSLITLKPSAVAIDPIRLARAQSTPKSSLVAHHGTTSAGVAPTLAPLAVQPAPTTPPTVVPQPTGGNDEDPSVPPPQPGNSTDLYEHALANASGYADLHASKAAYRQKARIHIASMLAGSLVLIAVAGIVAWQNSPALQLKVASLQAGVSAYMPDFAAAGFAYNGVHAGGNRLTFGLKGQSGNYQLTQANTNLSDADMIQTIGSINANGTPAYQVVLAGNTVVYRFNNTNATWVSNGKWYTLSGSNALSDTQIKAIVQHS